MGQKRHDRAVSDDGIELSQPFFSIAPGGSQHEAKESDKEQSAQDAGLGKSKKPTGMRRARSPFVFFPDTVVIIVRGVLIKPHAEEGMVERHIDGCLPIRDSA